MKKRLTFSDQIRQAVDASGRVWAQICRDIGISEGVFSRFMGGAWLGQKNMDALTELLGLRVTSGKHQEKKKRSAVP